MAMNPETLSYASLCHLGSPRQGRGLCSLTPHFDIHFRADLFKQDIYLQACHRIARIISDDYLTSTFSKNVTTTTDQ